VNAKKMEDSYLQYEIDNQQPSNRIDEGSQTKERTTNG